MLPAFTPELLLKAYSMGIFPMAPSMDSPHVNWICPENRAQLSIKYIHIPRRLKRTVLSMPYEIRIDSDFESVIRACAITNNKRPETWINEPIIETFCTLHKRGHAHSIECWQEGKLIGGLYGLMLGSAFCGESMFSLARDASKISLVHLVARLWAGGFTILDTQFTNPHLEQFGVYEIPHEDYIKALEVALQTKTDFLLKGKGEKTLINQYFDMRAQKGQ